MVTFNEIYSKDLKILKIVKLSIKNPNDLKELQ